MSEDIEWITEPAEKDDSISLTFTLPTKDANGHAHPANIVEEDERTEADDSPLGDDPPPRHVPQGPAGIKIWPLKDEEDADPHEAGRITPPNASDDTALDQSQKTQPTDGKTAEASDKPATLAEAKPTTHRTPSPSFVSRFVDNNYLPPHLRLLEQELDNDRLPDLDRWRIRDEPYRPPQQADEPHTAGPSGQRATQPVVQFEKDTEESAPKGSPAPEDDEARFKSQQVKDDNGFVFYKCRFCGLTYNYITTMKAHERVHDIMQPYACNKCGESFHYACELEYHAKSHVEQKGYKCDCGRSFFQYTDLLHHRHSDDPEPLEPVHPLPAPEPRQRPFSKIPDTDFPTPEFAEKGYEPKYQVRQYSEVRTRPYICQYCSKAYPDSRQLAYHMYSHRGERTFNPRASRYLMCRNENSYMSPGVWLND